MPQTGRRSTVRSVTMLARGPSSPVSPRSAGRFRTGSDVANHDLSWILALTGFAPPVDFTRSHDSPTTFCDKEVGSGWCVFYCTRRRKREPSVRPGDSRATLADILAA